jgi:hypothetical protein
VSIYLHQEFYVLRPTIQYLRTCGFISRLHGFNKTLNALLIINIEWVTGWGPGPASVIHVYMSQFYTSLRDMVSHTKT